MHSEHISPAGAMLHRECKCLFPIFHMGIPWKREGKRKLLVSYTRMGGKGKQKPISIDPTLEFTLNLCISYQTSIP